jgi:sugar/nucleoside kinase (ribokinase family)
MKSKEKMYDFLAIGSAVVDMLATTKDIERIDIKAPKAQRFVCISFASKTELQNLKLDIGGSAMNSAVTMARLGAKTALLSAIGNDIFGERILDELAKDNIGTEFVKVKKGSTGVGINLISGGGEKSVLVYRGVLNELSPRDLPEEAIMQAKHLFITSLVSKPCCDLFIKAVRLAKKHHRAIIFAPSISMLHAFKSELRKLHQHFDVVILNYEEGCYYTDKNEIKAILKSLPGRINVVTKDVEGAYAREGNRYYHIGAVPVEIKSTTGAGDAFNGAFTYQYYKTRSLTKSLKLATAVAAMKLTHVESEFHRSLKEVHRFVRKNNKYLSVKRI